MPIDPVSGLYSYGEPSFQPGGSSPALGGLVSLVNALQGQQNRQKALASQTQGEAQNVFKMGSEGMPMSGAMGQAASTLGVDPESQQAIIAATPQNRLRNAFQQIQAAKGPGERMTNDEILGAYTSAGVPPPSGLFGYMGRKEGVAAGTSKTIDQSVQRMIGTLTAAALPEDEILARVSRYIQTVVTDPDLRQTYMDQAMNAMAGASNKAAPKPAAQTGEIEARGGLEKEKSRILEEMLAPNKAKAYAQAGLASAHAELAKVATRIKEAEATGVPVTSDEKARLITALNSTEKNLGEATGGGALKSTLGGPAGQAANRAAVKELQDTVKTLKSMLGEGAAANKHFASEKEAIDAYKADHNGQAPSAAVIANMKAKGWF